MTKPYHETEFKRKPVPGLRTGDSMSNEHIKLKSDMTITDLNDFW